MRLSVSVKHLPLKTTVYQVTGRRLLYMNELFSQRTTVRQPLAGYGRYFSSARLPDDGPATWRRCFMSGRDETHAEAKTRNGTATDSKSKHMSNGVFPHPNKNTEQADIQVDNQRPKVFSRPNLTNFAECSASIYVRALRKSAHSGVAKGGGAWVYVPPSYLEICESILFLLC